MKPLLWLVLAASLTVNIVKNFTMSGVPEVLVGVGSGVVSIAAGVGLWMLRDRNPA
ncbi:hypothetical protein P8605_24285 [Streptomyces sp. T-3]|nr:hypothetical protein [Streptomyces sp. T-3]